MQKYNAKEIKDVKNIGVIMFGLFGDVLIRTPVIKALKEIYPHSKIVAIVDPIGTFLLEYNDYVDDVIVIQRNSKNALKKNIEKLKGIYNVFSQKFDLLVNLYNGGSSHLLVGLSRARYRLAFCNQKRHMYNVKNDCEEDSLRDKQSLYSYMITILAPLSSQVFNLQPTFHIKQESHEKMQKYLNSFSEDNSKVYLLNLGASKEDKLLEPYKYAKLVKYIYEKYNLTPAIIINPGQEYLQKDFIEQHLKETNIPYTALSSLSIDEIASLMLLVRFITTPDTGILHLAMAMNINTLAIFTYTHPLLVDISSDKIFPVYDKFDDDKIHQTQNISIEKLEEKFEELYQKL